MSTSVTVSPRTDAESSPQLWGVSVMLITALAVVFALPREKPLWLFALGLGGLLGIASLFLAGTLRVRVHVWNAGFVGLCAAVGLWSTLLISITQHYRRELPRHEVVRQLLQQFPSDSAIDGAPTLPESWTEYAAAMLRRRSGTWSDFWPALFLAEGAIAAAVAISVLSVGSYRQKRQKEAAA
jgi:hypothetical protein